MIIRSCARYRTTSGFTLIELLVSISIVVFLIAMLLPALGRARKAAEMVHCQSNLRQWGLLVSVYADIYRGRLPSHHSGTIAAEMPNTMLWTYLVNAGTTTVPQLQGLACPSRTIKTFTDGNRPYGYGAYHTSGNANGVFSKQNADRGHPHQDVIPRNFFLLFDFNWYGAGTTTLRGSPNHGYTGTPPTEGLSRHLGKANFLLADMSVHHLRAYGVDAEYTVWPFPGHLDYLSFHPAP